jgi:glucose-fructose oxidoreductase
VGLGYIAQVAVLPAFAHAKKSKLAALVSDDSTKLRKLGAKYGVERRIDYAEFPELLASGEIDAVYIALPNSMHAEYARMAANAGVHVLCEKPMATTAVECQAMIDVAEENQIQLMIAYRLHFERANLTAVDLIQKGRIGEPRIFSSDFTMQVRDPENIRLQRELGGGTLYDIGIYCINAARYLFRDEPIEVQAAFATEPGDGRFDEVEEMVSVIMRFPRERLATFTCSFGAADVSSYRVIGTKGDLRVEPAFEYAEGLTHHLTIGGKTRTRVFPKRDQFAPEIEHFSECIREEREPHASGREGLLDVRVIEALYASAAAGRPVRLDTARGDTAPLDGKQATKRPDLAQERRAPPVRKPALVHAQGPGAD